MGEATQVLPVPTGLAVAGLVLSAIFSLATLVPSIAVAARHLHDTGRSGWWQLLHLLPCGFGIGIIVLAIFWILPSTPGPNRFGLGPAIAD